MDEMFQKAEQAYIMELIMMTAVLYVYHVNDLFYWIIILLADEYMLKRLDIVEIIKASLQPQWKRRSIRLMMWESFFVLGIVIILFKQPYVAGILFVNDILVEAASFFKHMNGKKTQ